MMNSENGAFCYYCTGLMGVGSGVHGTIKGKIKRLWAKLALYNLIKKKKKKTKHKKKKKQKKKKKKTKSLWSL
jgi:hypothetical protein